MSRSRTRISRGLIGLLVGVIAIGLIFYFHNTSKSKATETRPRSAAPIAIAPPPSVETPAPTTAPSTVQADPKPLIITASPTTAPSTQSSVQTFAQSPPYGSPLSSPVAPKGSRDSIASTGNPLTDGKARLDAGDLLSARRIINEALVSGQLSETQVASAKQTLAQINQTIVFSPKRFADDEFGGTYSVQSGDLMKKIATAHNVTVDLLCRLNNLSDPRKLRAGATLKVLKGPFHAVVTKHDFTLEIWLGEPYAKGSVYVTTYGVGLGRDDSTPTGKWLVEPQRKLKNPTYYSPRGEGVIAADDPKNPLGEYWIGLTGIDGHAVGKMSYGIHGTIDPDSIGKQASMGCIRLRNEDAGSVYELLVEGKSTVTVRD